MTRTFRYAALAALGAALTGPLTGCVSNEKYQAQKLAHDALVEQLADAQRDASTARAEADAYKNQLTMLGSNGNSKDAMLVNLQQQNGDLQRQLEATGDLGDHRAFGPHRIAEVERRYADHPRAELSIQRPVETEALALHIDRLLRDKLQAEREKQ